MKPEPTFIFDAETDDGAEIKVRKVAVGQEIRFVDEEGRIYVQDGPTLTLRRVAWMEIQPTGDIPDLSEPVEDDIDVQKAI